MTKQIEKLLAAIDTEWTNFEEHLETSDYRAFEIIGSMGAYIGLLKGQLEDADGDNGEAKMTKQIEKLLAAIEVEWTNLEEHLEEHLETSDYLSFEIVGSLGAYIGLLKGELEDAKPM